MKKKKVPRWASLKIKSDKEKNRNRLGLQWENHTE